MSDINLLEGIFADGIHPNLKLLSHSSETLLHKCPRKYELYKLGGKIDGEDSNDEHLSFGKIVGDGVQNLLVTGGDMNKAMFQAFMQWDKIIDDERAEGSKKTFWHILYALEKFETVRQMAYSNYELVSFNEMPAVELGFSIDLGDGFFYRGKIDALLFDKIKRKLKPLECKTTKFNKVHEASYKNSGQGLGYGLIVDIIAKKLGIDQGNTCEVLYPVYKTGMYEWELFQFQKSHTQRATWIRNLLRDKQHVAEYAVDGYFPMHGENCFDFFRPCPHFGMCEMSTKLLVPSVKMQVEEEEKYLFKFSLEELIEAQLTS